MSIEVIKETLRENIEDITRIVVFDFDGTLVNSPLPDKGREVYKKKTGKDWPHKGWWSRPESLDMKMFDIPVMKDVEAAYNKEKGNSHTLMVMLTGRLQRLSVEVEKVLEAHGLVFDKYLYNTGGPTLELKLKSLTRLLREYPHTQSIQLFEDRVEHVDAFKAWGTVQKVDFEITVVDSGHH